jgi:hypothetical protein
VSRISRRTLLFISVFAVVSASLVGIILVFAFMANIGIPTRFGTQVYWLLWSRQYKRAVLSSSRVAGELLHADWNGDGWGGAPVGDWMGYVVYDPSDMLPTMKTGKPRKIKGIPCDVVSVRHLERYWYSVVADMNQFWDSSHPNCGPLKESP